MDIVFEGGGIKGLAYIGALRYLEERGLKINNVAGTSVGSIFASLIAVGYTSSELQQLIDDLDFFEFWPKGKNIFKSTVGTIKNKALYSLTPLENKLEYLFSRKMKTKFKDIKVGNNYKLKVITTNVNSRKLVVIPNDLGKFNINGDDFPISKAVCMSSAIPLVYQPYKINNQIFVDGGIMSNFPMWLFKDKVNVFGFRLGKRKKNDGNNIIYIDTSRYRATDFKKGFSERYYLYNLGYYYTKQFFDRYFELLNI